MSYLTEGKETHASYLTSLQGNYHVFLCLCACFWKYYTYMFIPPSAPLHEALPIHPACDDENGEMTMVGSFTDEYHDEYFQYLPSG